MNAQPTDASGPDAPLRAAAAAWERVDAARMIVLVEGVSDQVAVETAAEVLGVDLRARAIVVLPIGGAQAIANTLAALRSRRVTAPLCGLYDAAEEPFFARALATSGDREPRDELERLGFFACVDDLEDELIRAAGRRIAWAAAVDEGDSSALATLQKQPAWRDQAFPAQFRRFIGAGARRKLRYAEALVRRLGPQRLPPPLASLVEQAAGRAQTPADANRRP